MATIGDDLQQKGNLGGPDLFLAPIGRLPESSVSSYHCNVCEKDYEGCPAINYESPNETVADNLVLAERGQYLCTTCESPIAEYRVFNKPGEGDVGLAKTASEIASAQADAPMPTMPEDLPPAPGADAPPAQGADAPVSISAIAGMDVYDERARRMGTAREVGVDPSAGSLVLTVESDAGQASSIPWSRIGKVGDIIVLCGPSCAKPAASDSPAGAPAQPGACPSCQFSNKPGSKFCEQCGTQI